MKCPACGKENPAGEQYCLDCGAELAATAGTAASTGTGAGAAAAAPASAATPLAMSDEEFQQLLHAPPAAQKCPHCGAAVPAGGTFCDSCGEPLTIGAAGAAASTPVEAASSAVSSGQPVQNPSVMPAASTPMDHPAVAADLAPSATSTPGAAAGVTFEIGGPTSTSMFTLTTDAVQVGRRDPDAGIFPEIDFEGNDIVVDSGERVHAVSRRHGRIFRDNDGLKYEDLGSTNGSTLNGAAVLAHDPQPLKDGDKIVLGRTCRIAVHIV